MPNVRMPDGAIVAFPDDMTADQIKSMIATKFPEVASKVDPATNQPRGVPAYQPPGVSGYDPTTGDVTRQYGPAGSAAMGAADATTLGWGDELASYLGSGISGLPREQVLSEMRGDARQAQEQNPGSYLAGQVGGGLAQGLTGVGGVASNALRAGSGLGKAVSASGIDGMIYGAGYGSGSADDGDRLKGGAIGLGTGLGLGLAAPLAVAGGSSVLRKAISPFAISPERLTAIQVLEREGIPITAGQRTGNDALRYAESELGGRKAARIMDQQGESFTNAAMRRAGGSGPATPDNLASLKGTLGQQFEAIAARNTLRADPQLGQDIGRTLNRYEKLLESQQKPIISGLVDDIVSKLSASGGALSGTEYQVIRSDLSRAAQSTNNQTLGAAFRGLRNALDDAMDRSINPADAGKWTELRRQFGNFKVVQKASNGGGEDAALGMISPARLRMAASSGNSEGFATGASDFSRLAKAGQAVMTALPNSGTAARTAVRNLGLSAGGAGAGYATTGDYLGALGGAALPFAAGKALMWKPVQKYLANQAAKKVGAPASQTALLNLLRGSGILPLLEARN